MNFPDNVELVKILGIDRQRVYLCKYTTTGEFIVLKDVHPNVPEVKISESLKNISRYVISTLGTVQIGDKIWLLLPVAHGNLQDLTDELRSKGGVMDEKKSIRLSIQILEGIHAMHSMGVLHRDINLNNILFDIGKDDGKEMICICDFGGSSLNGLEFSRHSGTHSYLPPTFSPGCSCEKMCKTNCGDAWSYVHDIYGAGLVLLTLFTGLQYGTDDYGWDYTFRKVMNDNNIEDKFKEVSDRLKNKTFFKIPSYQIQKLIMDMISCDEKVDAKYCLEKLRSFAITSGLSLEDEDEKDVENDDISE